jgi:hypothetical protein
MPLPKFPIDIEVQSFYRALDRRRRLLELDWRQVARAADINHDEIGRLRQFDDVSLRCIFALSRWLRQTRPR